MSGILTLKSKRTYESAVHGIANSGSLRALRKKVQLIHRPQLPLLGPKIKMLSGPRYDKKFASWALPFLGADASVVRMGQQLSEALRMHPEKSRPVNQLFPVQFSAYFGASSFMSMVGLIIFGSAMTFFSKYEWGRRLLLNYPGLFSFGKFFVFNSCDA